MSLILDALRKSEAERKRGQAPGLFSPMPMPPSRRRRAPVWPMVAGVIGLILLAAIAIRYWPGEAKTEAPTPAAPAPEPAAPPMQVAAPSAPSPVVAAPPAPKASTAPPPVASAPAVVAPTPVAAAPLPAPTLPAPAPATPEPANDYLPSLAVLPPDQRANLPPLKLSMHVWSEQPARRIAIIDGQRVGEGSSLSGAIVAEIRRDGVALEINGQRYLLPRP